ncbi:carboxylesterase/lipase family protein [Bradyrhizobium diazoefficiens]|uniref:carboxylesterase/lipase family protein n=1 Tax=Bradyrhizobium diazoefficiens TaxID=1355477 RepID=UPI003512BCF8
MRARGPNPHGSSACKVRKTTPGIGLAVALATACASWSGVAAGPDRGGEKKISLVVETKEGRIQGFISSGVTKFLGIPYAEPPVGNLRWLPPRDRTPWTGVLEATEFAPICAQTTTLGVFAGPRNNNEDCLYLNVFTPDLKPAAPLPVIVYIHGGGNYAGGTPGYDGSKLASQGKVIVVTLAYRLNLMGFLAHPALDTEGHLFANYGVLDQQAALKWVQRNIGRFGGDKNNVTLGGQSSGAIDTMINLVSPLAAGLFHRAICQSLCPATYPLVTKAAAETIGIAFAEAAGCGSGTGPDTAECLRNLPAAKVEELAGTASATSKFTTSGIIVDGQIIPDRPIALFKSGQFNRVPLMNGGTKDEVNFNLAVTEYWTNTENGLRTPPTAEQYLNYVNTVHVPPAYSGAAAKVLALYPLSAFKSPQLAWGRVATDSRLCTSLRAMNKILAPHIPVYAYEFADRTAPSYSPDMPGMELQAYHTSDIQYLFPLWHGGPSGIQRPLSSQQTKLSDQIVSAWAKFARTGNPNGSGNSPWPRYTTGAEAPAWLIQDLSDLSRLTDAQFSALHHCDFWDAVSTPP